MTQAGKAKVLTLRDVVNHIMHFTQEMHVRFDSMFKDIQHLRIDVQQFRKDFNAHRKGVDDLAFRVQDIEEEDLPHRVQIIENPLKLARTS